MAAAFIHWWVTSPDSAKIIGVERGVPVLDAMRAAIKPNMTETEQMTIDYLDMLKDKMAPFRPWPVGGSEFDRSVLRPTAQLVAFGKLSSRDGARKLISDFEIDLLVSKPRLLLAMRAELPHGLLRDEHWDRLARVTEIPTRDAFPSFETASAQALLADTEIILAGWGCPVMTAAVLAARAETAADRLCGGVDQVFRHAGRLGARCRRDVRAYPDGDPRRRVHARRDPVLRQGHVPLHRRAPREPGRKGTDTKASWDNPRIGNFGKRVGIVGASRIGRMVIDRSAAASTWRSASSTRSCPTPMPRGWAREGWSCCD